MQLSAAYQVVAEDFGEASTAANALEGMMGMLQSSQGKLAKAGVKVFENKDGKWQVRNLHDLVSELGKLEKKDPRQMDALLGTAKDPRAALSALIKYEAKYQDVLRAGERTTTVAERFRAVMDSPSGKMQRAMVTLKETVAEAFTPERIEKFTNALVSAFELAIKLGKGIRKPIEDPSGFVDDRDEALGKSRGREIAADLAGKLTPDQMRSRSKEAMQDYANLYHQGHKGGWMGRYHDQMASSRREEGTELRRLADVKEGFDIRKFEKAMESAMSKAKIVVNMDSKTAREAIANSPHHPPKRH